MSDPVLDIESVKPAGEDLKLVRPEIRPGGVINVKEEAAGADTCAVVDKQELLDEIAGKGAASPASAALADRERRLNEARRNIVIFEEIMIHMYLKALEEGTPEQITEAENALLESIFNQIEEREGENCFCRGGSGRAPRVEELVSERIDSVRRYLREIRPETSEFLTPERITTQLNAYSLASEQRAAMQRFVALLSGMMPGYAKFFEEALLGKKRDEERHTARERAKENQEETTLRGHIQNTELRSRREEDRSERTRTEAELFLEDELEVHEEIEERIETIEWEIASLESALDAGVNPDQPNLPLSEPRRQKLSQRLAELLALLSALRSRDRYS
jgi:hypothetical protein